ncbi:MAG: DUF1566 domain-containing protein [Bacteroidales bacterium]|nr:DUF1566 domain-containing protein [Bacteroidales bacterium]
MNKRFSILVATALFISSLSLLVSCDSNEGDDPKPEMKATSIELVSGGNQTAMVETTLENPVIVLVKDQEGNVFAGETVKFAVSEGSVSAVSVVTDANGKANITWTLGASEGTQTLTVTGTSTLTGSPLNVTATATPKPAIGDFYAGGVVFYLDATGTHGLVCAVTDQSDDAKWGCKETTIDGADGTTIGTGAQNTLDILAGCFTEGTAADLCSKLDLNGYDDWFLPSEDELNEMYENKATINTTALANGGTAFTDDTHWSSSEENFILAHAIDFTDGTFLNNGKAGFFVVRAIREF